MGPYTHLFLLPSALVVLEMAIVEVAIASMRFVVIPPVEGRNLRLSGVQRGYRRRGGRKLRAACLRRYLSKRDRGLRCGGEV